MDEPAARQQGPQFARFAAAMDEARARGAPQLALYTVPSDEAAGPPEPRRAAHAGAPHCAGRQSAAACSSSAGLLVGWLVWPQTAQLVTRWLAAEQGGAAARIESVLLRSPLAFQRANLVG